MKVSVRRSQDIIDFCIFFFFLQNQIMTTTIIIQRESTRNHIKKRTMTAPRRVSSFAALFGLWSCAAVFGCVLIRGVLVDGAMGPCLDAYARRLGVTALPKSASAAYRNNFCQYTYLPTSNGRIEIFGGSKLSSLQLYRARKILEFYLEDVSCADCPGKDKRVVRNKMGKNKAKLDMPNGAHEQPGAGKSLLGQELYQMETPVEGDSWFMNNNMNVRFSSLPTFAFKSWLSTCAI